MGIAVLGSLNMDWVVRCPHLPQPGETLLGYGFTLVPGGKGGNQAVAVARMGAATRFMGQVGTDAFGETLLATLVGAGIDTIGVDQLDDEATGIAAIAVDDQGENHIIVVPGANGTVGTAALDHLRGGIKGDRLLLLQLEVSLDTVLQAAQIAHAAGVTVILDPAPVPPVFPPDLYALIDVLTPNQGEAAQLVGHPIETPKEAIQAAWALQARGVDTVIITRGDQGCLACQGGDIWQLPPFPVTPIDTVAAGDAFNGGLAAAWAEGHPWPEPLRWAGAAGAIAVTRVGAQSALPTRDQVMTYLAAHPHIQPHRL